MYWRSAPLSVQSLLDFALIRIFIQDLLADCQAKVLERFGEAINGRLYRRDLYADRGGGGVYGRRM